MSEKTNKIIESWSDTAKYCAGTGVLLGLVGAVWGGYEIGTAINDHFDFASTALRTFVDGSVMSTIFLPSAVFGLYTGAGVGGLVNKIINRNRSLSDVENIDRDRT